MRNIGPDVTRIECIFESYSHGDDSLKTGLRMKREVTYLGGLV